VLLFLRWPAPLAPQFNSNSNIDAAFFALAGQLVRDGGTPYLTFWDHKPPLIHLIDAAALTASNGAVWGLWLASLATFVATLGASYVAWRRMFGATAAVIGAAYFAFSLGLVAPFNLTEGFALPIQAASMLVLTSWASARGRVFAPALAIGMLAGIAFMLRPNLMGGPTVAAMAMALTLLLTQRAATLTHLLGGLAAGAAITAGPVLLWVGLTGALDAFVDQVFRYNAIYSAASANARIRAAFEGLAVTTMYGTLLLPIAGWLIAAYRLRASRSGAVNVPILCFALMWLPLENAFAAVPGRSYMHYFAMLLLPLATVTCIAIHEVLGLVARVARPNAADRARHGAVVVACGAIAVIPVGRTLLEARDSGLRDDRAEQVDAAARFVRASTAPTDRVLVWGHAADVYLLAGRRPASRFVYPLPLLTPGYADSALVAGFVDELRATAPPLIVDATPNTPLSERLVPTLGTWKPNWQYPADGVAWWSMTPAMRQVYDYVAANYEPVRTVGPSKWVVYRRVAVER
jgi:hypothetical protein